jgi:hypothetical protein
VLDLLVGHDLSYPFITLILDVTWARIAGPRWTGARAGPVWIAQADVREVREIRSLVTRGVGFRARLGELGVVLLWDGRGRDLLAEFVDHGWPVAGPARD